jgi:hypothetical protein
MHQERDRSRRGCWGSAYPGPRMGSLHLSVDRSRFRQSRGRRHVPLRLGIPIVIACFKMLLAQKVMTLDDSSLPPRPGPPHGQAAHLGAMWRYAGRGHQHTDLLEPSSDRALRLRFCGRLRGKSRQSKGPPLESDRADPRCPGLARGGTAAFRDRSPGFSCKVLPVHLGDPTSRDRFFQNLIPVALA